MHRPSEFKTKLPLKVTSNQASTENNFSRPVDFYFCEGQSSLTLYLKACSSQPIIFSKLALSLVNYKMGQFIHHLPQLYIYSYCHSERVLLLLQRSDVLRIYSRAI